MCGCFENYSIFLQVLLGCGIVVGYCLCLYFGFASLLNISIGAGVVVAVALHEVHDTPDCETCAQSDNESLKNTYCAVEKCHIPICRNPAGVLLIMLFSPDCKSRNRLFQRLYGC